MHKNLRTHLDISTCHITEKDFELLDQEADVGPDSGKSTTVPNTGYLFGKILFILHYDGDERREYLRDVVRAGYSTAMVAVIKLAWELEVAMVRLDRDAPMCKGLVDCSGECQ